MTNTKEKRKLIIEEQIEDLKKKNVKFDMCSEEKAKSFLKHNNYFFKLKSYSKNFDKYSRVDRQNQYINLDFAYLIELSTLDSYLRKWIIATCLDIEHILKTQFINDITYNPNEDGYSLVKDYIKQDYTILSNLYSTINKSATSELVKKFQEDEDKIPVWSFIETLSFGRFIELYNLYYNKYGERSYASYLGSIKYLRNAAAHNTCLLNSLRRPYAIKINKNKNIMNTLSKIKKLSTSDKKKMENPVVHDFVVILFVYWDILDCFSNKKMREKGMNDLKDLFNNRMKRNKDFFEKNDVIVENYRFICTVIDHLEKLEKSKKRLLLKK